MLIVTGHVTVDPERRKSYLAGSVMAFRRRGPGDRQRAAMVSVLGAEYDVADVRPVFGKARA